MFFFAPINCHTLCVRWRHVPSHFASFCGQQHSGKDRDSATTNNRLNWQSLFFTWIRYFCNHNRFHSSNIKHPINGLKYVVCLCFTVIYLGSSIFWEGISACGQLPHLGLVTFLVAAPPTLPQEFKDTGAADLSYEEMCRRSFCWSPPVSWVMG